MRKRGIVVALAIALPQGRYRFTGLDPNVDYEIHAEHRGLTSATHRISSSDVRREIIIKLKMDKKKFG